MAEVTRALEAAARWVRVLQFTSIGLMVLSFIVYIFADELVGMAYRRAIGREMTAAGIDARLMSTTPPVGFRLVATYEAPGDLVGAAWSEADGGLWLADGEGALLLFEPAEGTLIRRVGESVLTSPRSVSLTPDNRLLVADLGQRAVLYLHPDGGLQSRIEAPAIATGEDFQPLQAVHGPAGRLYVLNAGRPAGILVWPESGPPRTFISRGGQAAIASDGTYLYSTGMPVNRRPLAQVSAVGSDVFAHIAIDRLWALPYWDRPFTGIVVDHEGFITLVDERGDRKSVV